MRSQWLEAIRACGINLAYSSTDGVEKNMDRLALITLSLIVVAATAQASLIGTDVTVSFVEEGFSDLVDIVTVDGARHEIVPFDGTNIGNQILLDTFSPDTEFIDIANERIVVGLEGSGDPHPVFAGHTIFGFPGGDPMTRFVFSNLTWGGIPGSIDGVDIILDGILGVNLGAQVTHTQDSNQLPPAKRVV